MGSEGHKGALLTLPLPGRAGVGPGVSPSCQGGYLVAPWLRGSRVPLSQAPAYECNSEKGKEDAKGTGWGALAKQNQTKQEAEGKTQKKRERIKPLICPDFPLHRVISLEVTEIK